MRLLHLRCILSVLNAVEILATTVPTEDGRYTITSKGIKAQVCTFISYGATLTNLFVNDKSGNEVDVVLGYDNASFYAQDKSHPTYNSIPGRYANRIGKAQFTIDGKTFRTQRNDGQNTLHSGTNNWSYRNWNVTSVSSDSITFSIVDREGESTGMPGQVEANVTYSVANGTWSIRMVATSLNTKTPLMLTHHTYFNLDAYKNPSTALIWDHTLSMPYAKRYLAIDGNALPTGKVLAAAIGSVNDFSSQANFSLGHARGSSQFKGNCGTNCEGYNGFWIFDDHPRDIVLLTLASLWSGIKAELRTNQVGVVLYTCAWSDGSANLKRAQGMGSRKKVEKSSCIAIEAQDYVDGINHQEWDRMDAQITGPGETYIWDSSWTFGTL
ncbi:galactose mutarotase-like domain-containing protein [Lasiosphaeris hirsuta]|uniref:Galactose mutarotase-like domain-containing protein n=1 Tax=Lasiosphaeris hirsuta TaxID=260670 RepID=A0AA39ZR42_9PEZI|nr:galactose mutarotase-like domain-containing protein [Lasiosphaeris hirsuta]